jgi:hypothetical protein
LDADMAVSALLRFQDGFAGLRGVGASDMVVTRNGVTHFAARGDRRPACRRACL